MIALAGEEGLMRHHATPTLRELHANRFAARPSATAPRRPKRFWEDDPDLAPPARKEAPLTCWA